jgi:glucokinase
MAFREDEHKAASTPMEGARLVADVGGTNVRFAVVGATRHELRNVSLLRCADYPNFGEAVAEYLRQNQIDRVLEMCIAVAGPMEQDSVDLPNNHWSFSLTAMRRELGAPLTVINDFTAQALAIDALEPDELAWLGTPRPAGTGIRTVLGPGTGLGIGVLTVDGDVIPSEGGHIGFAPSNEHEMDILERLRPRFRRVSVERLISGPGLENIYRANRQLEGSHPLPENEQCPADRIAGLASEGDAIAVQSVQDFFDILAAFAGDVSLFTWSTGGVYLSGGVMRRLSEFLDVSRFRSRFEDKGRFAGFCTTVPLAWITHEYPGLLGCAALVQRETPSARQAGSTGAVVNHFSGVRSGSPGLGMSDRMGVVR